MGTDESMRSKMHNSVHGDYRTTAPVVRQETGDLRLLTEVVSRPLRFAFVVHRSLGYRNLCDLLGYACTLWGGYYALFVPTDGVSIEKTWWRNLHFHRPDIVYVVSDSDCAVADDLVPEIERRLQPFECSCLSDWPLGGEEEDAPFRFDRFDRVAHAMLVYDPLFHELEKARGQLDAEHSRVILPSIAPDHPLYLHVASAIGMAKGDHRDLLTKSFFGREVEFDADDMAGSLASLELLEKAVTPLGLTTLSLQSPSVSLNVGFTTLPYGLNLICYDESPSEAVCLLRALELLRISHFTGHASDVRCLALPFSWFSDSTNLTLFADAIVSRRYQTPSRITVWASRRTVERANALKERLGAAVPRASVKVRSGVPETPSFIVRSDAEAREIPVREGRIRTTNLAPAFGMARVGGWALVIESDPRLEIPMSSKVNHLVAGKPAYPFLERQVRYTDGGLAIRVDSGSRFVGAHLPTASDAICAALEDHGINASPSNAHRYIEGCADLFGSTELLTEDGLRELLRMMQRSECKTIDEMSAILRMGDRPLEVIDELVRKRVLQRGLSFACKRCGLRAWHPIGQLDETVRCSGCHATIRVPIRAAIVFRLNELIAQACRQGAVPVLLTRRFLQQKIWGKALSLCGLDYEIQGTASEVDYVTSSEGYLILAECKDFRNGAKPKEMVKALAQIRQLVELAKVAHAPATILATLLPHPCEQLTSLAHKMRALALQSDPAVHLLALGKMAMVDLQSPDRTLEDWDLFQSSVA